MEVISPPSAGEVGDCNSSSTLTAQGNAQLEMILARFETLYPMLVKQRAKASSSGLTQAFISASNQMSKESQAAKVQTQLALVDRIKLITVLAKSEINCLELERQKVAGGKNFDDLIDALLAEIDAVCRQTDALLIIPDRGLFLSFLLMRLVRVNEPEIITKLFTIILKRAENYITMRYFLENQQNEDNACQFEISLVKDERLGEHLELANYVLKSGLLKSDINKKNPENWVPLQTITIIQEACRSIQAFVETLGSAENIKINEFPKIAIWFDVLKTIYERILDQNEAPENNLVQQNKSVAFTLDQILGHTFKILAVFRQASKYFASVFKKDALAVKIQAFNDDSGYQHISVRERTSKLYGEILDCLTQFCVLHLKLLPNEQSSTPAIHLFNEIMGDGQQACFTTIEQLRILKALNHQFMNTEVYQNEKYWDLIISGVADRDQVPRKVGLAILKQNLSLDKHQRQFTDEKEFELLWTTFFDIHDTLESFGSHLAKAVWHRVEVFYSFLKKYDSVYGSNQKIHPLEDFRMWLQTLYKRVVEIQNLKVRRFVIKETLKREYITPHMGQFFFYDYLCLLNTGLIFKDHVTAQTSFSKNAEQVYQFYTKYFQSESRNVSADLLTLFDGIIQTSTHPQMFLIFLKVLGTKFGESGQFSFIGNQQLKNLKVMMSHSFYDQYFSSKYLCQKFIVQAMALYITTSSIRDQSNDEFDWSNLFVIIGYMPSEFFSKRTIFQDEESHNAVSILIDTLGLAELISKIGDYLTSLFTVKAMPTQIPKFSAQADLVLKGILNLTLGLVNKVGDQAIVQLQNIMDPCTEALRQALSSSYLQNILVETKISYFVTLIRHLFHFGSDNLRAMLSQHVFLPQISQLLSRFNDNIIEPLSRESLTLSEKEKIEASFGFFKDYGEIFSLAIKMIHMQDNQSFNALESAITNLLQKGLKITSEGYQPSSYWTNFLLQHALLQALQRICETYSQGISEQIKKGQNSCFVPDDLFTIGSAVLSNLITFQPQTKLKGTDDEMQQQMNFLTEQDSTPTKVAQDVMLACWKIQASLVDIFQHDQSLKQELLSVTSGRLANKAEEFLSQTTDTFCDTIFRVLKLCYIPLLKMKLIDQNLDQSLKQDCLEHYQIITKTCWTLIKNEKADVELEQIQEFIEFAFAREIFEAYQFLSPEAQESVTEFHKKLAKEIFEHSWKYWLILRALFNHMMFMFATKPHLMIPFWSFVMEFGICRELRSLDSEIKLYKIQTMIPEIIPKRYESFNLEHITYHGAYVRSMTLLIVEGIIKQHLAQVKSLQPLTPDSQATGQCLELILRELLESNFTKRLMDRAEQPYSEGHRLRIRNWQYLLVMLQLLDPDVYTPAYRQERVAQSGFDIISEVRDRLWKILKQNHVPSVRQYLEMFAIKFVLRYPDDCLSDENFFKTMLDPKLTKPQVSSSMLMIVGFIVTSDLHSDKAVQFKKKIFEKLLGFATSNSAHSRCIAQYFLIKLQGDSQFGSAFLPSGVKPIIDHINGNKDVQKMYQKYSEELDPFYQLCYKQEGVDTILTTHLNECGEFVGQPIIDTLRSITTEVITEFRQREFIPIDKEDYWKNELERRKKEGEFQITINEESSQNYQKKILPWEELEVDVDKQKKAFTQRNRNEIIMCASLIDKVPNLAGLSRTCEIMNASSLVINNGKVMEDPEFLGISVTSEKWLPIYQVIEKDLLDYLAYQKSNGYKILGLEQTANSKMLHEFNFPSKCILLLGKEKEGIPQEYYGILDECIEIPQFGVIRSLNVHVSGALCLWEYTKQQLVKKIHHN